MGRKIILVIIPMFLPGMTRWIILLFNETRNPGNRPSFACKNTSKYTDFRHVWLKFLLSYLWKDVMKCKIRCLVKSDKYSSDQINSNCDTCFWGKDMHSYEHVWQKNYTKRKIGKGSLSVWHSNWDQNRSYQDGKSYLVHFYLNKCILNT